LLVFGDAPTASVAAVAALISEGLIRRRPLVRAGFNAGHTVLSLLAAGGLYELLGGRVGRFALAHQLPALGAAVVCLWLCEAGWVAVAVVLERGGGSFRRLAGTLVPMLTFDGALASVGLLLALLYEMIGKSTETTLFLIAVALIPSGLLFYAYRLRGQLQETYAQSLRTLGALMEAKLQAHGPGHGERVAALAAAMAQALELPPPEIEQIRYGGYLHDIGKVGVAAQLLNRRRDIFSGEPEQLRLHPQIGEEILSSVHFLGPAKEMVRAHHERWDGLGYPEGTQGGHIPLGARMLAVANAYVGMTQGNGSAPLPAAQALLRLRQAAGSRFDPEMVAALESLPEFRSAVRQRAAGSGLAAWLTAPPAPS
jgi:hypothetical protein